MNARYVHTNIIAKDWRVLTNFYCTVFGCVPVPPERDYKNEALDKLTGIKNAHQFGMHLRLPGYDNVNHKDDGPTLEIFSFDEMPEHVRGIHHIGYGHIAFAVENVEAALQEVLANGGGKIGEIVSMTNAVGATVMVCYATDPEGNAIELQRWIEKE